jgi:carbonic anhydrase/acetyltransferase-like protein (isoleucine patch superfamily)
MIGLFGSKVAPEGRMNAMNILSVNGFEPIIDESAWVADTARVVGHVKLAAEVSVWFGTVIRGDQAEPIEVGARTNIQDGAVLHSDPGQALRIGTDVTVGHQAMLHGCTVGDGSLIGIGATVLNGAVIGRGCLVGAGALVTEGKVFPEHSLIIGSPAKVARTLTPEQVQGLLRSAGLYVARSRAYRDTIRPVSPASHR